MRITRSAPAHAHHRPTATARLIERALWIFGLLALGWCAFVLIESYVWQWEAGRRLDEMSRRIPAPTVERPLADRPRAPSVLPPRVFPPRAAPPPGALLGRLEIPRIGIAAVVREGADDRSLRLAVGHIPGTALPGEKGNAGLAGHRDSFFRNLRRVRVDDVVRMKTPDGVVDYRVASLRVVSPAEVHVLDPTSESVLTLVTCYPFDFVGSAPTRFVVRAIATDPRDGPQSDRSGSPVEGASR